MPRSDPRSFSYLKDITVPPCTHPPLCPIGTVTICSQVSAGYCLFYFLGVSPVFKVRQDRRDTCSSQRCGTQHGTTQCRPGEDSSMQAQESGWCRCGFASFLPKLDSRLHLTHSFACNIQEEPKPIRFQFLLAFPCP